MQRTKVCHYKTAVCNPTLHTLQDYVTDAIENAGTWESRIHATKEGEEGGRQMLINFWSKRNDVLFGEVISFHHGKIAQIVEMIGSQQNMPILPMKPSDGDEDTPREFVDNSLYFLIQGNHIAVIQSSGLRCKSLEQYLNWLVSTYASDHPFRVALCDRVKSETRTKANTNQVRSIKIGSMLASTAGTPETTTLPTGEIVNTQPTVPTKDRISVDGDRSFLQAIREHLPARLLAILDADGNDDIDDSLDQANLNLRIELTYHRKTNPSGQQFLDHVAYATRHMDGEDIEVSYADGTVEKGTDIKLKHDVPLPLTPEGLPDLAPLSDSMSEWLRSLARQGRI